MPADAGARQIYELLTRPSERLGEDADRILRAVKRAPSEPYGAIPQDGADAVADMRAYFREMRAQIEAIDTVDTAAKTSALEALGSYDRAIGAYERSLEFGISKPALPKLRSADKRAKEAKKGLRGTIGRLSG